MKVIIEFYCLSDEDENLTQERIEFGPYTHAKIEYDCIRDDIDRHEIARVGAYGYWTIEEEGPHKGKIFSDIAIHPVKD